MSWLPAASSSSDSPVMCPTKSREMRKSDCQVTNVSIYREHSDNMTSVDNMSKNCDVHKVFFCSILKDIDLTDFYSNQQTGAMFQNLWI